MAEETTIQDPQPSYIDRVYTALKDNLQGFNKTPEQFAAAMKDSVYASKAYTALKDNLQGFDKSPDEFYQQVGFRKAAPAPSSATTFQGSSQDLPLSPVLPQGQQEVAQRQQQDLVQQQQKATAFSNRLKEVYDNAEPALKKEIGKIQGLPLKKETVSATPQGEVDHMNYMNSTLGKVVTPLAYLGSKASHGAIQIAKGLAHVTSLANNPAAALTGTDNVDNSFKGIENAADLNLTKGDISRIEEGKGIGNHLLSGAGMLAEFAPAIAGGEATAGTKLPAALMYLQGVGAGKDAADKIEGLNPIAKEALIQGSGIVNLALTDLGSNIFGKGVSSSVKDKVVAGIAADAIKESAGKQITADSFESLLKNKAASFAQKFERAPMEALKHYTDAAKTFAKLDVGNFAVHKAVDKIQQANGDQPVFNENAGTLAESLNKSMTEAVPMFGTLGALGAASKLLPNSSYENDVVKSVMNDPSPENVDAIKQQIHDHGFGDHQDQKWAPEEMDATFKHIDKIAQATKSLPATTPENKRAKAIGLVLDRNTLQDELKSAQDAKTSLDPAVKDLPSAKEQYLTDKIEQANDKLRDIVTGKRTTYSKGIEDKEQGKFFKTTDGAKEEITPSRYELERTEREAKQHEQTQPNQEVPTEQPADETNSVPKAADTNDETTKNSPINSTENGQSGNESNGSEKVTTESGKSSSEESGAKASNEKEKVSNSGEAKAEPDAIPIEEVKPVRVPKVIPDYKDIRSEKNGGSPEGLSKIVNEKTWYHGSGKDLSKEGVNSAAFTRPDSLLGLGFYMTDNPEIADTYAKLRRNNHAGIINEFKVKTDKILDAEKPVDKKVADVYKNVFQSLFDSKEDADRYYDSIKEKKPSASLMDYHKATRELVADNEMTTSDALEYFQDLEIQLKDELGYDAISHIGGVQTGGKRHNVIILLDPSGEYSNPKKVIDKSALYDTHEDAPIGKSDTNIAPVRQKAIDAITHGIVGDGERPKGDTSPRFDLGMNAKEQKRAIRDITNGDYESAAAKKMIDKVSEFEIKGEYPIIEGLGGGSVRSRYATPEDIQQHIDDAKQFKLAKEQDIEANNQGLKDLGITHQDIQDYENYRNAGEPGTIPDNGRTTENAPGDVQRAENDKTASVPQGTGGEAAQGSEAKAGDPLRAFADKVRQGKINKLGGFRASTGFDSVWDASLEVVAKSIEGGAKIADAIEAGLKHIRSTDWYKNLNNKSEFDQQYKDHLSNEYAEVEKAQPAKNETNESVAKELGLEVDKSATGKRTNKAIEAEASEAIAKGYDTPRLVDKILNDGHAATDVEVAILAKYRDAKYDEIKAQNERLAADGATMPKKQFEALTEANDASLNEMQDVVQAIRKTGSLTGSALRARQLDLEKEFSLGNMIAQKRQALGGEKLSPEELSSVTKKFTELEQTQKALEARLKKVEDENAKLKAEQVVKRASANRRAGTKAELAVERSKIFDSIRDEFKKIRQSGQAMSDVPYRRELAAVAKHMPALLRNLAQEGVVRIEDVVDNIYTALKSDLEDITKRDVTDLIAGKYNEVKPTRSELQDNIRSLRTQAKLIAQIEDAEKGIKPTDKPSVAKEKNEKVEALKQRLKELTKEEGPSKEEQSLANLKKRLQDNIDKISLKIAEGDYSKEEPKKLVTPDAEALALRRKYDRIKNDFDIEVAKDALKQRTKAEKLKDNLLNIFSLPRALKASLDFSAVLRQGLFGSVGHHKEALVAFKEMFRQTFSEEKYKNWISDLKHSEYYDLMKNSELYLSDKNDPKIIAREEEFTSNLADKIPVIGKAIAASERAYTGYLNVLRAGVFESQARELIKRGYTFENNPEVFKGVAKVVNVLTGRGDVPEFLGGKTPKVLSNVLFSPRFMAARIQTLYLWADPRLPREAKLMAARDIGATLGVGISLLSLASLAGYKVVTDPRSTQFLKIQDKNEHGVTYYDILGGLPQYVRLLSQIASGKKVSANGKVTDLSAKRSAKNPFGETRGDVELQFLRGKLSPVIGGAINLQEGKDVVGQPYNLWPQVPLEFVPLPYTDVSEAYQVGGIKNALKVLIPSQFGISVSSYNPNAKKK